MTMPGGLLSTTGSIANLMRSAGVPQPDLDAHEHEKGLLGAIRHGIGADRVAPELGALLSADQRERVKPGLLSTVANFALRGRTPQQVQMERAATMLGLQDAKVGRDRSERQRRIEDQIQAAVGGMEPQAGAELAARMRLMYNLPQAAPMAIATDQMRLPQMQARANAKLTVLGEDGNYYAIQQDAMGAEVPGSRVRVPKPTSGITYREGKGPDGAPVIYALPAEEAGDVRGSVAPRSTGLEVPETGADTRAATAAAEKRANDARMLTDDLAGVNEALEQLKKNPNAFGLENILPSVVRSRLPGAAEDATTIGSLEYVVGRLRHDRFGGALSALEADKAARIFSEPKNPAPVIRAQLEVIQKALIRQAESIKQQQSATPTSGGEKTITVNGKTFRIP